MKALLLPVSYSIKQTTSLTKKYFFRAGFYQLLLLLAFVHVQFAAVPGQPGTILGFSLN